MYLLPSFPNIVPESPRKDQGCPFGGNRGAGVAIYHRGKRYIPLLSSTNQWEFGTSMILSLLFTTIFPLFPLWTGQAAKGLGVVEARLRPVIVDLDEEHAALAQGRGHDLETWMAPGADGTPHPGQFNWRFKSSSLTKQI